MNRIIIAMMLAVGLLAGCGGVHLDFQTEIDAVRELTEAIATGGGNIEEFRQLIEDFNAELDEVEAVDDRIIKYVEIQRNANDLRLEGFEQMDFEKINESTALQAEALEIYNEIKDGSN